MSNLIISIPLEEFKTVLSETVKQEVEKINLIQPTQTDFINRRETAQILGVSLVTLNDWSKRGLIPVYRIGSRVRYKKQEIIDSLESVDSKNYGKGRGL